MSAEFTDFLEWAEALGIAAKEADEIARKNAEAAKAAARGREMMSGDYEARDRFRRIISYADAETVEEKLGLQQIYEAGEWDYSWSLFRAWIDLASGTVYYADESGCSCNGFLEDVGGLQDLIPCRRPSQVSSIAQGFDRVEFMRAYTNARRRWKRNHGPSS